MLEAVQGEGGVVPLPADYLRSVEQLCRERGILLICDEVQCGMCRTGRFWAYEHAGIKTRRHKHCKIPGKRYSHGRNAGHG